MDSKLYMIFCLIFFCNGTELEENLNPQSEMILDVTPEMKCIYLESREWEVNSDCENNICVLPVTFRENVLLKMTRNCGEDGYDECTIKLKSITLYNGVCIDNKCYHGLSFSNGCDLV
jgi:hypothetical protein